ncbi:LacI family DNA-binding transcriptional regulator [Psychromonas aquimarina]|uniref:LacI family DNA-binding transcriptional regulator n=1 Tax=Psychromonas aquimarina TaxID=444919 RepID=UPI0003F7C55F|nr:LacI family DNA-binding transcriptional regulator [Psychromonas aquimarina]
MANPKTINSAQIAKLAGVSRSTVSKVVNNYPDIPEETKNKVRSVMEKHGYTPNAAAQVLKGKAQSVVALYIYASETDTQTDSLCRLGSPYVMGVISNFIMAASQCGYRMMVELLVHGEDEQEIKGSIKKSFESKSITAAVFLGLPDRVTFIDQLVAENFPVAVIDRDIDQSKAAVNIYTNDSQGAYQAAHHLHQEGFKSICFIGGDADKRSARMREEGYCRAMQECGASPVVIPGHFSEQAGAHAAEQIIKMSPRPEAVVCASDAVAYGLIRKLREIDAQYLDILGIVGFDDTYFNDFQHPPLSSLKVDFAAMARSTIAALLDPEHNKSVVVPVELVVRASSLCRH